MSTIRLKRHNCRSLRVDHDKVKTDLVRETKLHSELKIKYAEKLNGEFSTARCSWTPGSCRYRHAVTRQVRRHA